MILNLFDSIQDVVNISAGENGVITFFFGAFGELRRAHVAPKTLVITWGNSFNIIVRQMIDDIIVLGNISWF